MSECIKYCGQCNKTDLPNIIHKEPIHIGYSYAYKTDCDGDAYIKAEEVKSIIEQVKADAIIEAIATIVNTPCTWASHFPQIAQDALVDRQNEIIDMLEELKNEDR